MKYSKKYELSASDLVNFLGCKHLTELERSVTLGNRKPPNWNDPSLAILQEKGRIHEASYIKHLHSQSLTIKELTDQSMESAIAAMKEGYDIVTQENLTDGYWIGRADILRKVEGKSHFGNWTYEIEDTKLAQETKAGTVLQLSLYTDILSNILGTVPKYMHAVKPGESFPTDSFLFTDFAAYYRLVKNQLENVIANQALYTYPKPVPKCDTCRWWKECDDKWHDDDHLSLIAGISTLHTTELQRQGIRTLEQYASEKQALREKPERGHAPTYHRIQDQAKIQLRGRNEAKLVYELFDPVEGRGLNRLPKPSEGDVYFDIEGDHFYDNGGLEYLLGISVRNNSNQSEYHGMWGLDRSKEKEAFEQFMSFIMKRWGKYSDMNIYHFAPYEPSAIKRLATRHGTFESEVDRLLRGERFVDLHAIIKEGLRGSVERYSLKDMELFASFKREIELRKASAARRRLESALQLECLSNLDQTDYQVVEDYNKDDCLATAELHDWIEERYHELESIGHSLSRPELKTGESSQNAEEREGIVREIYDGLVSQLPADRSLWNVEEEAKWLLAHQIEYFRREDKSAWWDYFRIHEFNDEDLLDERKGISGLQFIETVGGTDRCPFHRYSFPQQEVSVGVGKIAVAIQGDKIGEIVDLSIENGTIDIKKLQKTATMHPIAIHINDVVFSGELANSLQSFAQSVIENGINGSGPFKAGRELLMKAPPQINDNHSGALKSKGESINEAAIRLVKNLDNSYLPIQGPPGTGKTHSGAEMIIELYLQDKKIGVTAISHKAIRNLLEKVLKLANERNIPVEVGHKVSNTGEDVPEGLTEFKKSNEAIDSLEDDIIVGGTSWLWARDDAVETLDCLFVDEAGQMSLANVLAVSRATKNLVLLGDPQQLEQPQQGSHPEGADIAALNHVLEKRQTISPEKGLFLNTSWRLNPNLTAFTSEVFYESKLTAKDGLEVQALQGKSNFSGSGLFYVPVVHEGNQNQSIEEVRKIKEIVEELLNSNTTWTNRDKKTSNIERNDILIVAPYNAQVAALTEALPDFRIGTVDKFQGQEAPVVIYSMTSSSPDDAPRGMSFLYSPNRLNVATSRAQCICILVATPKLLEPECHTIDQMKWANALCRFKELASIVTK